MFGFSSEEHFQFKTFCFVLWWEDSSCPERWRLLSLFSVLLFFPSLTTFSSPCVPCRAGLIAHLYAHPSHNPSAVGPLELANALAACCLSSRLSSQHRQWAAQQLVRTLAAHDRDNNQSRPQTFADMAGDLRKCSCIKLEAHQSRVGTSSIQFISVLCVAQSPNRHRAETFTDGIKTSQ